MKTFYPQDLWEIIEEWFTAPINTSTLTAVQKKELKENKQKDSKSQFILQQDAPDTIFSRILGATSAKMHRVLFKMSFKGLKRYMHLNFKLYNVSLIELLKNEKVWDRKKLLF